MFFLSDIASLMWYHEGATLGFTEEKENLRNLEVLLEALGRNNGHISHITVGLEQFGSVWRLVYVVPRLHHVDMC